ncbi:MAG: plastocyanin/azurin family copper-binding protein [Candidatus Methanoperedens sp.]|nr:plastocyanin/azurin family copper-binding protein [Candidatus Methanoperedens sp.]
MKKTWLIGFLIFVVLVSGCTSAPDTAPQQKATPPKQATPPPPMSVDIRIEDFMFFPPEVILAKGGTVTWSNKDTYEHTVTSGDFASSKLGQGQTFSHTFNDAGTYDYWCTIHASMRAKVIVK